jgi:Insertion element 4 transposase N-terminal/Transposase DDE domain
MQDGGPEAAPRSERLTDLVSIGVLADVLPRDLIDEVLNETGKREVRSRLLPAHVIVRFCQAMCLFYDDDYEEVMRKLVGSLRSMRSWSGSWHVPSVSAISQARRRLGPEPMRELFERVAEPVAELGTKGAWLNSRRLMAVDGFVLDVPDTPSNIEKFGLSQDGKLRSSYPQVRVVGLGECGSHAIVDASLAGCKTGEQTLLPDLFRSFGPDMLVLADRNFYGFELWRRALETGASLAWRVSASVQLPVVKELDDGSYLSVVFRNKLRDYHRTAIINSIKANELVHPAQAIVVRVVEYDIPDRLGNRKNELIRLITSILDPADTPAIELAAAYHERWEFEGLIDEIKTHQRGPGRVLRSKTSDLVEQEVWSLLLTHFAIRELMCRAADEADADPDRLSFIRSLRVVRRSVTDQADFSP